MSSQSNENPQPSGYVEFNFSKKSIDKIEPLNTDYIADENPANDNQNKLKTDYDAEYILKNSNKPLWRILRLALQIIILLVFIGLLAFIIAVIVIHPGCEKAPELEWWQKSLIYRIDFEKFKELGKDNGLLNVVEKKLSYFEDNNADAIWLSSIVDLDKDFTSIHTDYGTIKEFEDFITAAHDKNFKVILDFIPNYTTDKSEWFIKNTQNDELYKDFYIWSDNLPNNWKTVADGGAWTKNNDNGKFYYHKYGNNQPDLNYRNPKVVEQLYTGLKFWLDKGVDGFNLVGTSFLFEDYLLRNETKNNEYTQHQRETFSLIAEIKDFLNHYGADKNKEIALLATVADETDNNLSNDTIRKYYGSKNLGGTDLLIFHKLFKQPNAVQTINGNEFMKTIDDLLQKFGDKTPIWMLDQTNLEFEFNASLPNLLHAGLAFLPGSTVIQIHKEEYKLLSSSESESKSDDDLYKVIGKVRRESKALSYSKLKYEKDIGSCQYTEFMKYYDGESSYSFHFDIENSNCPESTIKLKSNLIIDNTVNVVEFIKQYSNNKEFKDPSKISFDSKGDAGASIPRHAFVILSWSFQPPDIKDIL